MASSSGISSIGRWKVKGDSIWGTNDAGWIQMGAEPADPTDADTAFTPIFAEMLPGNPRGLRLKDCEEGPNDCVIQEFRFVGAVRLFSLPLVGPGASVRETKHAAPARFRSDSMHPWIFRSGRLFDVMGRERPSPYRGSGN